MIKKNYLLILLTILLLASCSKNDLTIDSLPVIDITKKYPEKEIILSRIAEIKYVHLDSRYDGYLYRGTIKYIAENSIVVNDVESGSILFFSKDGNPKSRFNRYGNGPEEYLEKMGSIVYDEETDDVFVSDSFNNNIQVYSSKGEYKRKLILPYGVRESQMRSFDNQSLIMFDEGRMRNKALQKKLERTTHMTDSSFFLISKTDGQVLNYIPMSDSQNNLTIYSDRGNPMFLINTNIVKHAEGFLLCNPETDTVFLFSKTKELTPIICKIPSVGKSEAKIILNNCIDVEKYQFMQAKAVGYGYWGDNNNDKYFVRDKKTGEVYQQKIVIPEFKGKKIVIYPGHSNSFHENGTHIELDLMELKLAYRENKLSGKLKELVATLNENEDNNVW